MRIALAKIEFLQVNGPKLRGIDMRKKEVLFLREEATRGFAVIKQGQLNNSIYMVFRGKVNIVFDQGNGRKIKMLSLGKGSIFGMDSALRQMESECSYEVASKVAVHFKIDYSFFEKHFEGEPLNSLFA